jgi:hypothetical protein
MVDTVYTWGLRILFELTCQMAFVLERAWASSTYLAESALLTRTSWIVLMYG